MHAYSSLLISHSKKGTLSFCLSAFSYQLSALRQSGIKEKSTSDDVGSTRNRALRILIAGGGTGGHLFPGIAIAQEFQHRNAANRILFVSSGNPLERSVLAKAGFELGCITAAGIKGRGIWNQLKSSLKIPIGILESMQIIKKFGPDLAIAGTPVKSCISTRAGR